MKLIIEEGKIELPVRLYLEEHGGYITLCAKLGTTERVLLQFYEDGRVKRRTLANI